MNKGWLKAPGIRPDGDRTLEEQMLCLDAALDEVHAASLAGARPTVLDLGCAEGLIGREFARAGAADVLGIEILETHLAVARLACADLPMRFECDHLAHWAETHPKPEQFDVVLCLSVAHKLHRPSLLLRWAARSARSLLVYRGPSWQSGDELRSKFQVQGSACNVRSVLEESGLALEQELSNPRQERVQYWRR
jgi:2-polyprenyl-3-methyl-5-hydroxy-6-metoxy-1,4-benzoquinol methylase